MDKSLLIETQGQEIIRKISEVYHLPESQAVIALKSSAFYKFLLGKGSYLLDDGAELNFLRYQNEVEYGAWNQNGVGGIAK